MLDVLTWLLVGWSLLLTVVVIGYVVLDRLIDNRLIVGLLVLWAGLWAQLVIGVVKLVGTDHDVNAPSFVGYLVGGVLMLPAGVLWANGEKSRAGTGVLVVVLLATAALVLRLDQLWNG